MQEAARGERWHEGGNAETARHMKGELQGRGEPSGRQGTRGRRKLEATHEGGAGEAKRGGGEVRHRPVTRAASHKRGEAREREEHRTWEASHQKGKGTGVAKHMRGGQTITAQEHRDMRGAVRQRGET